MRFFLPLFAAIFCFNSCLQRSSSTPKIKVGNTTSPKYKESVATFAEGCFWHSEIIFQSLNGVRDAVSGYAGGSTDNPDYETVSTGNTGHAETVQVYYDSATIDFPTLVAAFFESQDPTTPDRQGNDVGSEYRSIAFYRNETEKNIIEAEIKRLTQEKKFDDPIVTEVVPFTKFYRAEDRHQEYISRNPGNPYVQNVSIPEYIAFKSKFKCSGGKQMNN